ncbi:hypothetical protein PQX77_011602 [Marasmius sp. AFHP31]|nr:hypothetical protein PQX77_011602 [Marasmius sp. AFHP31]
MFTSDRRARTSFVCQSSRCDTIIAAGEPYFYVGNDKKVKLVCPSCQNTYRNIDAAVRDTFRRPNSNPRTAATTTQASPVTHRPSARNITSLVNASFHKDTHNTYKGHVVPISKSAMSSGPTVLVPSSSTPSSGSSTTRPESTLNPLSRPRANGYTSEHQQYSTQLARFKSAAYAKGGDMITIQFSICYQVYGKKDLVELTKLSDVMKDVDAHLPIHAIRQVIVDLALKKLTQHEEELAGSGSGFWFAWKTDEFNIRDVTVVKTKQIGSGVDLDGPTVSEYGPDNPYLLTYGSVAGKDKKWKRPRGPVSLRVVISAEEYDRFGTSLEEFAEQVERAQSISLQKEYDEGQKLAASRLSGTRAKATNASRARSTTSIDDIDEPCARFDTHTPSPVQSHTKSKRTRSGSMTTTPPRGNRHDPIEWQSPSTHMLRTGLSQAGRASSAQSTNIATTTMQGVLAFIPSNRTIQEVLGHTHMLRLEPNDIMVPGSCTVTADMRVDHEIGTGGFKTCHLATITLFAGSSVLTNFPGLEILTDAKQVCLKQVYIMKAKSGGGGKEVRSRFSGSQEFGKIQIEANTHYWAAMLLKMAYEYIDTMLQDTAWPAPPRLIPRLRYVQAAIFLLHARADPLYLKGTPVERTFLMEELIPMEDGDRFVKYIHNGNANPNDELSFNDPDYPKAEFLSAIQHLQFDKMQGLAYVSDFQGYGDLLTDAQLMTSPDLADGEIGSLFGDGNVEEAFSRFPEEHVCNDWCVWFGFGPLSVALDGTYQSSAIRKPNSIE